jgi:hypothetical protein
MIPIILGLIGMAVTAMTIHYRYRDVDRRFGWERRMFSANEYIEGIVRSNLVAMAISYILAAGGVILCIVN